jgi:glycine cleavage system aminomethyltransferase T
MTVMTTSDDTAYTVLCTAAAVWTPPAAGVLRLTDADRVDFLQRMTTNDIKALRPGASCVTVLTSPTAKITHVFTVLADADTLWLLPRAGRNRRARTLLTRADFLYGQSAREPARKRTGAAARGRATGGGDAGASWLHAATR